MGKFFVYHKHTDDDHGELSEAWQESARASDAFKGQPSYCSCPSGEHEVFVIVDADSPDDAKKVAPQQLQGELTVSEVIDVPI
jgi:hypothetical protein